MAFPVPRPLSILVVQPRLPEPDRDSGSLRLWTLIELLVADGHHVTFLAYVGGERRGALLSGDPDELAAAERTRTREIAVYGEADGLVTVSSEDAHALADDLPDVPVHVVGNVHGE